MAYFINGGPLNKNQAKRESSFKQEVKDLNIEEDEVDQLMHSTYKEKSLGFSIPFLSNEETIDDDKKSPDFIEFE